MDSTLILHVVKIVAFVVGAVLFLPALYLLAGRVQRVFDRIDTWEAKRRV